MQVIGRCNAGASQPSSSSAGAFQPSSSSHCEEAHTAWITKMADDALAFVSDAIDVKLVAAHPERQGYPAEPRQATKKRRIEMRAQSFSSTIHSMQRAYAFLLHNAFDEDSWDAEPEHCVRDLSDALEHKLEAHCGGAAEPAVAQGKAALRSMLAKQVEEFKWMLIAGVGEAIINRASEGKKQAYQDMLQEKQTLQNLQRNT